MKIRPPKSSINSTALDSSTYLEIDNKTYIKCTIDNFNTTLVEYRYQHNKFVPRTVHNKMIENAELSKADIKMLEYALNNALLWNVNTSSKALYMNDQLLASQLANPKQWACYPIPDKLHITVDLAEEDIEKLLLKSESIFKGSQFRINRNKPKRQNNQYYKDTIEFSLKSDSNAWIKMFFGDHAKSRCRKHNLLRIELIPARFTYKQLNAFFRLLKRSKVITNYKFKMQNAKVSRCDIAIDFIAIPTPFLILDKVNVNNFCNHTAHVIKDEKIVETLNIGLKKDSHIIQYCKTAKILSTNGKKSGRPLPILINENLELIDITRVEKVNRQHQLRLCNLHNISHVFKSVEIYQSTILKELDETKLKLALKDGYMVFLKNECDQAVFTTRSEYFKRYRMYINHDEFKLLQSIVLKKLQKCIISPKSYS